MRLEDASAATPRPLRAVGLGLTRAEAAELRDSLDDLLTRDEDGTAMHHHVSSADYQRELSVWLEVETTEP